MPATTNPLGYLSKLAGVMDLAGFTYVDRWLTPQLIGGLPTDMAHNPSRVDYVLGESVHVVACVVEVGFQVKQAKLAIYVYSPEKPEVPGYHAVLDNAVAAFGVVAAFIEDMR